MASKRPASPTIKEHNVIATTDLIRAQSAESDHHQTARHLSSGATRPLNGELAVSEP